MRCKSSKKAWNDALFTQRTCNYFPQSQTSDLTSSAEEMVHSTSGKTSDFISSVAWCKVHLMLIPKKPNLPREAYILQRSTILRNSESSQAHEKMPILIWKLPLKTPSPPSPGEKSLVQTFGGNSADCFDVKSFESSSGQVCNDPTHLRLF